MDTSPSTPSPTAASILATYVSRLERTAIPENVLTSAKMRILDMIGNIVGSQGDDGPTAVRAVAMKWSGTPQATLIGSRQRLPAPQAALVNGTFGHARDFDDTHHASRIHASTVVVPAALAAAEAAGASGDTTLTGVVAGLEVAVRTGMVAPGRFHERGLHATSVCGVMGAAAASASILGLDAGETAHALGIAGSFASGLREAYLGEPTDTKALHAGWAARAGVTAAELAKEGFTGPTSVFEGRFGFYRAFVSPDDYDLAVLTRQLGERWYTPEIVFKLYPCGSLIHAMIDAAVELHDRHHLDPDTLREVVCIAPEGMVSTVLAPVEQKLAPKSGYHAKFSAQYTVAVALHDGAVTEASFAESRVHDPDLRQFLAKVSYETDPSMPWPDKYPGGVRVTTDDGRTFEARIENSPGSLDRPASVRDVVRKFRGNAEGALAASSAEAFPERAMRIEEELSMTDLLGACASRD